MLMILIILNGCSQTNIEEKTKINNNSSKTENEVVSLNKINNFYIGDNENLSLIHEYIPENTNKIPVIMIPGLGLGANIYESTPDGRNGWAYYFLKNGYQVYTVDTSDLVSAGISETEKELSFSKWDSKSIWTRWGLGSGTNQAYENGKFPIESFEQFYSSIPMQIKEARSNQVNKKTSKSDNLISKGNRTKGENPSRASNDGKGENGRSRANLQEVNNIVSLLNKIGPAILLVHSMGGEIEYEVTRQSPDLVKGIVAIEPVGSPTEKQEIKDIFSDVYYLGIYGDYLESRNQINRYKAVEQTTKLINGNDGTAKVIRLTEQGIKGNSHLMMIDKNNEKISDIIIEWLNNTLI